MIGPALFGWLHGADFYRATHAEAVALLPTGQGRTWLDVGCGPGLVARLAAARGYTARGVDAAPGMIRKARRIARAHGPAIEYTIATLDSLPAASADVVSAGPGAGDPVHVCA